jgi:hypothetical protein
MRRNAVIIAMVIFSALFTYGFVGARQSSDTVPVDVKPKPGTTQNKPYDPNNPPPGATGQEDGYTSWQTVSGFSGPFTFSAVSASGTRTYTLTITKVVTSPKINITIYLPPAPGANATAEEKAKYATLQAHEQGHADIAQKTFDLINKGIMEAHVSKVQKVYTETMPDPGNDTQAQQDLYKQFVAACQPLVNAACTEIDTTIQGVSDAYDTSTNHGTTGADGSPSNPKNQGQAANQAYQNFQQQYNKH